MKDERGDPVLGDRVRARREELNWSQEGLAKQLGHSQMWVSYVENGQRGVHSHQLRKLAEVLGVTPGWLMGDPDADFRDLGLRAPEGLTEMSPEEQKAVVDEINAAAQWAIERRRRLADGE